jgi:hypothetical protein
MDGLTDVDFMRKKYRELNHILNGMPRLNANWGMFKKAVIILMGRDSFAFLGKNVDTADEEATVLRTIMFHIRREWYRKSSLAWMQHFKQEKVDADPAITAVGPAAAEPHAKAFPAAKSPPAGKSPPAAKSLPLRRSFAQAFSSECYDMVADDDDDDDDDDGDDAGPLAEAKVEAPPVQCLMAAPSCPAPCEEPREDSDSDANDIRYEYGKGDGGTAWRQLCTNSGIHLEEREYASHVTDRGPTKLCAAHFLDGTHQEIRGMFGVMQQPAKSKVAKKKPASAKQVAAVGPAAAAAVGTAAADLEGDEDEESEEEEEEDMEEEEQLEEDEEEEEEELEEEAIEGEDAASPIEPGGWAWIEGLAAHSELNGKACRIVQKADSRWLCKVVPCETPVNVKPMNLKPCELKECIKKFNLSETVSGDKLKLTGTPQKNRTPLFLCHRNGKQIGLVSTGKFDDAFDAWNQMLSIYNEMKTGTVEFSNSGFYARREELDDM